MTFQQALKTCFTKYASPFGRASRKEFWYFMLFYISGWIVISIAFMTAFAGYAVYETNEPTTPIIIVSTIATIWWNITIAPVLAVIARRLHDTEKSGWWTWVILIPIIGTIQIIVWCAQKTQEKENVYGKNPLKQKSRTNKFEKIEFLDAVKIGFNKYITLSGRATRAEFWYFMLAIYIVVYSILGFAQDETTYLILVIIISIISTLILVPITVRRLHDLGKSGWWWWMPLYPIVGSIILFVWLCSKGEEKKNKYGAKLSR